MLLVVLVPVAPVGKVQMYEVALEIAGTEYTTLFCTLQMVVVPVMVPAVAGNGLTVIALVVAVPSPHSLCPFTVMIPETAEVP